MFSMRHLQVFLAVVDAGCSVSGAAERLHVAQPAVSKTLTDLDAHFGTVLFERLNRRLRLSEAGKRLVVEARQLVDSFMLLDHGMRLGADRLPLRVGATHTVGAVYLPGLLARREAGTCPLEVQVCNTLQIEHGILDSSLDVGVVEGAISSADIRQLIVANDEVIAVAAPNLKSSDVLIVREPGSGTRDAALQQFAKPGCRLWSLVHCQLGRHGGTCGGWTGHRRSVRATRGPRTRGGDAGALWYDGISADVSSCLPQGQIH